MSQFKRSKLWLWERIKTKINNDKRSLSDTNDFPLFLLALLIEVLAVGILFRRWRKEPRSQEVLPQQDKQVARHNQQQEPHVIRDQRHDVDNHCEQDGILEVLWNVALHVEITARSDDFAKLVHFRLWHVLHEIVSKPGQQWGCAEQDDVLCCEAFPE